ncbi:hypothetical protein [Thiohalocapsa sp. ML1]|uniref:hypothetical protein n=1 Tax=Thiohalocapsa sp. ML1 TaxID=1431688 RepID=UPI0012E35CE7|nr:hypothetical protein [Thiohalocapsa sp. ML1]
MSKLRELGGFEHDHGGDRRFPDPRHLHGLRLLEFMGDSRLPSSACGQPARELLYQGAPGLCRLKLLEEAILSERQSAYSIAQVPGQPHHGWLKRQRTLPTVKLRKSIRSFRKLIVQHEAWVKNPYLKFPRDAELAEVRYHQDFKWPSDIARHYEQIDIL